MTSRRDRKCMVKPKSYFMKYKSKTKGNFIYLTAGDSGRLSFITLFKCCNLYHVHPAALNVDINWNKYDFFLRRYIFQSRSVSSAAQMNINPENNENQVMERGNQQSTSNEQASMSGSTVRSTEKQRESGSNDGDNYQYDLPCPDGIM